MTNETKIVYDIKMGDEHQLQFDCAATSDDSTPVTTEWYFGDSRVHKSQRVTISPNGTMTISLPANDTVDNWGNHAGWYTCKATNGYSHDVRQAVINVENFATTLAPSAGGGCGLVLSIFNQFLHIIMLKCPSVVLSVINLSMHVIIVKASLIQNC